MGWEGTKGLREHAQLFGPEPGQEALEAYLSWGVHPRSGNSSRERRPQGSCTRMLYSGLLPLQLRTSGPCPCLEESMEEWDEKPPEPLKACAQVSELPFPRETQRLLPPRPHS